MTSTDSQLNDTNAPHFELNFSGDFDSAIRVPSLEEAVQPWSEADEFLPTIIVYSVAFVCGIVGNALVLFALLGDRKARESNTSCVLVSLAVADLLFLLICIPYESLLKISGYVPEGRAFCKAAGFVEIFTTAASIWNLTFISIER